jgi:pyruvate, water dikinase
MENFVKKFSEAGINDIAEVGVKNAALGDMFNHLVPKGIHIPNGFAITITAFKYFMQYNALYEPLKELMEELDRKGSSNLNEIGAKARKLIMEAKCPRKLELEIIDAYNTLFPEKEHEVAVRNSATTEDLANADFTGLHESYLNIKGPIALIYAIKCCFASLYNNRAIKYYKDIGLEHNKVFLSVGIQQMVRSDIGSSGIGSTSDPVSGSPEIIYIAGIWGLGENIMHGTVTPDEFVIEKPTAKNKAKVLLKKNLGSKNRMLVYKDVSFGTNSTLNIITPPELREKFVLEDHEIMQLAEWALILKDYYKKPVLFEWAKDGLNQQFYIIQALPRQIIATEKMTEIFP